MKIFISQSINIVKSYKEKADTLSAEWVNYFFKIRPDILLIPVPNNPDKVEEMFYFLKPQGLILSSGNDIKEFKERDHTEKKLIDIFLNKKKPILGICRGMQLLNIYFGGKIKKNKKNFFGRNHSNSNHHVDISNFDYEKKKITVNSFHDYGIHINDIAENFKIFASCDEKIVEGFYDFKKKVYAVQWHPERKTDSVDFDKSLINKVFKK